MVATYIGWNTQIHLTQQPKKDYFIEPVFSLGNEVQTTNLFKGNLLPKKPFKKHFKGIVEKKEYLPYIGIMIHVRCFNGSLRIINEGWLELTKNSKALEAL